MAEEAIVEEEPKEEQKPHEDKATSKTKSGGRGMSQYIEKLWEGKESQNGGGSSEVPIAPARQIVRSLASIGDDTPVKVDPAREYKDMINELRLQYLINYYTWKSKEIERKINSLEGLGGAHGKGEGGSPSLGTALVSPLLLSLFKDKEGKKLLSEMGPEDLMKLSLLLNAMSGGSSASMSLLLPLLLRSQEEAPKEYREERNPLLDLISNPEGLKLLREMDPNELAKIIALVSNPKDALAILPYLGNKEEKGDSGSVRVRRVREGSGDMRRRELLERIRRLRASSSGSGYHGHPSGYGYSPYGPSLSWPSWGGPMDLSSVIMQNPNLLEKLLKLDHKDFVKVMALLSGNPSQALPYLIMMSGSGGDNTGDSKGGDKMYEFLTALITAITQQQNTLIQTILSARNNKEKEEKGNGGGMETVELIKALTEALKPQPATPPHEEAEKQLKLLKELASIVSTLGGSKGGSEDLTKELMKAQIELQNKYHQAQLELAKTLGEKEREKYFQIFGEVLKRMENLSKSLEKKDFVDFLMENQDKIAAIKSLFGGGEGLNPDLLKVNLELKKLDHEFQKWKAEKEIELAKMQREDQKEQRKYEMLQELGKVAAKSVVAPVSETLSAKMKKNLQDVKSIRTKKKSKRSKKSSKVASKAKEVPKETPERESASFDIMSIPVIEEE